MHLPGTGHHQIDAGHDRLLVLLEKLRYNPDPFLPVVEELAARLREHCDEEEAIMRAAKYRGRKAHVAEHQALAALLTQELPADWGQADGYEQVLAAVDRARQGLMDHILGLDHDLAVYLLRKQQRDQAAHSRRKPAPKRPAPRTRRATAAV